MIHGLEEYLKFGFPIPNKASVILAIDEKTDSFVISTIKEVLLARSCSIKMLICDLASRPWRALPVSVLDEVRDYPFLFDITSNSIYHSEFSKRYTERGGNILIIPAVKKEGFVKMFLEADIKLIVQRGVSLKKQFIGKRTMRITSPYGTDFTVPVKWAGLDAVDIKKLFATKGRQSTVYGQIAMPVDYEGANGSVVISDYAWPPASLGILKKSIKLLLRNGAIVGVDGAEESQQFAKWLDGMNDPMARMLTHVLCGFIPGVQLSDSLIANERIPGAITYGFGDPWNTCSTHIDMTSCNESVFLDDELLNTYKDAA